MSRPRTIKLGEGTVKLQDFSTEQADAIESLLLNGPAPQPVIVPEPKDAPSVQENYPDLAIGLHQDPESKKYVLVLIGYDLKTGATQVLESQDAGGRKWDAHEKFKVTVVKKGILK